LALNRQAVVMARLGVPIERSVLAGRTGRICRPGALIAPAVDRMAVLLKRGSTGFMWMRPPPPCLIGSSIPGAAGRKPAVGGPCCATVSHCGAIGSRPMANGRNGPAPPGDLFHCHPGREGEHVPPAGGRILCLAHRPGQTRVAQIRSGRGHGL